MPLTGDRKREYMRQRYAANKERLNAYHHAYYKSNREKLLAQMEAYNKAHPETNRASVKRYRAKKRLDGSYQTMEAARMREWRKRNREAYLARNRAWVQNKYKTDPAFRIICRLRSRLHKKLANRGIRQVKNSLALTGCDAKFLRGYLEGQFTPGMTWENIHIDHHIPCDAFDLTDPKQQEACFNYSNLKPLLGPENLKKGKKLPARLDAE